MAFTDLDAVTAWNAGASAWDTFVESGADYYRHEVHGPALLAAYEPLCGRRVLDLGCGQGYFSRQLAGRGARVEAWLGLLALSGGSPREERRVYNREALGF